MSNFKLPLLGLKPNLTDIYQFLAIHFFMMDSSIINPTSFSINKWKTLVTLYSVTLLPFPPYHMLTALTVSLPFHLPRTTHTAPSQGYSTPFIPSLHTNGLLSHPPVLPFLQSSISPLPVSSKKLSSFTALLSPPTTSLPLLSYSGPCLLYSSSSLLHLFVLCNH